MANKLIWGSDLYKGFKLDKGGLFGEKYRDILPFQMLSMEEKTPDWIHAVADYYEMAGWVNVEKKAGRIQRNFDMRYGKLTKSDYIINPTPEQYFEAINMYMPNESKSPLEQFYSLAPTFVDVLRGEFIKRDNRWTVETIDSLSVNQVLSKKEEDFKDIIYQQAIQQKTQALAEMGLSPQVDPQQYQQQMEQAMKSFTDIEQKTKTFRTTAAQWAEKVIKIHEKRYNLHEIEPDAFESGLITDSEFWHIDLLDDDFRLELLNSKYCDYHKGPNVKYVSKGDYFLWFDFMSAGDIVNNFGRKIKEEDLIKLKDVYVQTANMMVPDYLKPRGDSYYDMRKPWLEATDLNPAMNDSLLGKELAYNYMRSPNFEHNIDIDIFSPNARIATGKPQMFRVMRLYWRSLRRVGWLTKILRDGTIIPPDWVDENYRVTVEPQYDKSVVKEETKDNLLYGEHIDWTWAPEWRHVMKIAANHKHSFWFNSGNNFDAIYVDGGPVKFQFKGRTNPFDSLPPVEGCIYSYINSGGHAFMDRLRSLQILFNICMNKVPKKFLDDKGIKVAVDKRSYSTNNASNIASGLSPREEYEDRLHDSQIIEYTMSRDAMEGMGQPVLPHTLNLSTAQEALFYLDAADRIKWMAGEQVGITRQRVGGQKASETATGIQQGINYSETQTEKYFEQHSNLMERVRQRMLDAAQYYTTFNENNHEMYQNTMNENTLLNIEGMDNLLPHYNIHLESRANVRSALQTISQFLMNENTLPIAPSAKINALIDNSIPRILNLIQESELEQIQREEAQAESEQQQKQAQMEHEQQMAQAQIEHQDQQKALDRESNEKIATIRALGGVQTDADKNGINDASENIKTFQKQQELLDKRKSTQDTLNAKTQIDTEKMMVEREKSQTELQKEKIKGEYALAVAKENKNKYNK